MNTVMQYSKYLILCLLTAMVSVPAITWGHGFVGYPIDRQSNCKSTGGHWSGYINDDGCRTAAAIHQTDAEKAYPTDQFHEYSIVTGSATTPIDQILSQLKPGQVCSANDEKKASMSVPTGDWTKTSLTAGSTIDLKLFMTAIHVPSRAFVFITKPGFNSATTAVSTSDLLPLGSMHTITSSDVKPPPAGTIPKGLWASGVVTIPTVIPGGLTGSAVIVLVWARDDSVGETFVMCSDVTFGGGPAPVTRYLIGPFVDPATLTAKPGDQIRHRVISNGTDVSDAKVALTPDNLTPARWSRELKDRITNPSVEIGELQNGSVKFNTVDPLRNHVFYKERDALQNMTVIEGGGPAPIPTAVITGPTELKSGQTYSFVGELKNAQNTPQYAWAPVLITHDTSSKTVTGTAPKVAETTPYTVRLNTRDGQTGSSYTATHAITISPASGGDAPAYTEGTPYKDGDIVSNNGKNYKCKPWPYTAWCAGAAWAYAPGKGTAWGDAWEEVP